MIKKIFLSFLFLIVLTSVVYAAHPAAYIIKNNATIDQTYIDAIESMDFIVDVIEDSAVPATDFSEYIFILVGEGYMFNTADMPVNEMPSLIINTFHMNDFHWASSIGGAALTGIPQAGITSSSHQITEGFPVEIDMYLTMTYHFYDYIPWQYKAPGLDNIAHREHQASDLIVAAIEPGASLLDSVTSNSKGVFFGISDNDYWTNYSSDMFMNAIEWLTFDSIPPSIDNLSLENLTDTSVRFLWDTDQSADSTLYYGLNTSAENRITYLALVESHEIFLSSLDEATEYYYIVQSCNDNDLCTNSTLSSFSTLDLTAPSLVLKDITGMTNSSVNISVFTDEDALITIYYSTDSADLNNTASTAGYDDESYIILNNLGEFTKYYYIIQMCDASLNCRNTTQYDFTTTDLTDPASPTNLLLEVNNDNSIRLTWTHDMVDVDHFNIYAADEVDGFDFMTPNFTSTTDEYTDTAAQSAQKRYYIVRAEDSSGNEEDNENKVVKFDLELNPGYNLVSFPIDPFTNDIASVMHQNSGYSPVSEIKKYSSDFSEFYTSVYDPGTEMWSTTPDFNEMKEFEGYMFYSNQMVSHTIVGYPITSKTLEFSEGLNLVGLTFFDEKTLEEVFNQSASGYKVDEVFSRNNDGTYEIAVYYPSIDDWFNEFSIESGKSYWVKSNQAFSLEVSLI